MTFYLNHAPETLNDSHRHTLEVGSAISREVHEESVVWTLTQARQLPRGFSKRQRERGSGMLFLCHRPNGKTSYAFRPDNPDPDKPGRKYEQPCKHLGGPGNVLYVHPSQRHLVDDTNIPVIFVEGIKKALSIVTAARAAGEEVLVVAISGVWNWLSAGKPIPDMSDISVEGREAYVCFDSDVFVNPDVGAAAHKLAGHLTGRGAVVYLSHLPEQEDGSKTGADDFLAGGRNYRELMALMRLYDPRNLQVERLTRDEWLRACVDYLWQGWHARDWQHFVGDAERPNWQRGHTARDVMEALIRLAPKDGKSDERGIVFRRMGLRRIAELAAKSAPSVGDALRHLEKDGQLEILPQEDKSKARSYRLLVPRAALYSMKRGHTKGTVLGDAPRRCKGLRAPTAWRMRWSSPARPARLVRRVEGTTGRAVVEAVGNNIFVPSYYRPYAGRLGPHRGAVLDALEHAGGELHLEELCKVLHRNRPRDVRRRLLRPLEEAGIIECDGDVIRLAAEWLARLDDRRKADGEIDQAEKQLRKHRREQERYRLHLERQKKGTPEASIAAVRRSRDLRSQRMKEAREEEERRRAPVSPALLEFVTLLVRQNGRLRIGLLRGIANEEGYHEAHVPRAVEELGLRVERLSEFDNEPFAFAPAEAA